MVASSLACLVELVVLIGVAEFLHEARFESQGGIREKEDEKRRERESGGEMEKG